MKIIVSKTDGKYGPFSNFYVEPFVYDGITYKNSEAAFQAMKTLDLEERQKFSLTSPSVAKKLGRKVRLRSDWEDVKYGVMVDVLMHKFSQNESLKKLLIETGDALIVEQTTWHDNCWGYCICPRCRQKYSTNLLGRALMEVRSKLAGTANKARFTLSDKEFEIDFESDLFKGLVDSIDGKYILNAVYRFSC